MMRILKFGGKSLSSTDKIKKICKFIKTIYKTDNKLIIVVSAMGNTTNELIEKVKDFKPEKSSQRDFDVLLSTGETISSSIFSIILNSIGVPAKSFQGWQIKINTHGAYQNSLITSIDKTKIEECLNNNKVVVVSGFQGINSNGDITTLGRGGSDTTASALGATFNTNVELYSDFDGIFNCDPREILTNKINSVSLNQLERITSNGVKLVSNRAVKIAKDNNLSIKLKSSIEPKLSGSIANQIEKDNIFLYTNTNLCELNIDFSNKSKLILLSKNVLIWLKNYKIYSFIQKSYSISIIINQSDKNEILNLLCKKLKILKT